jgi:hypothetical protein
MGEEKLCALLQESPAVATRPEAMRSNDLCESAWGPDADPAQLAY